MRNLITKKIDLNIERNLVLINSQTLDDLKIKVSANVKVKSETSEIMCEVISTEDLVPPGKIGLNSELLNKLKIEEEQKVNVFTRRRPASLEHVKNKREGNQWSEGNIRAIVQDICGGQYTDLEISMFTLAQYYHGLSMDEVQYLTSSMAEYGTTIDFEEPVYDK
ncbi:MAG: hypothetical protein V3V41_03720, partial [Candidatus Heimdallarchaeota archaeon]